MRDAGKHCVLHLRAFSLQENNKEISEKSFPLSFFKRSLAQKSEQRSRYQCAPITILLEVEILAAFWEALCFAFASVSTSVGRVLIKSIPVVTGICPIRRDSTGMVTGMTCALVFWHGWNSIPVQCQSRPTGANTHARIHTVGIFCKQYPWGAQAPHGYLLSAIPVRNATGIAYRNYPWDPWSIPRVLMSVTLLKPTLPNGRAHDFSATRTMPRARPTSKAWRCFCLGIFSCQSIGT